MRPERNSAGDFQIIMNVAARDSILTEWNELLCEIITDMAVINRGVNRFNGEWTHYRLGPIDLNFIRATPQVVFHNAKNPSRFTGPDLDFVYLKQGTARLRHHGKAVLVPESTFVLLDNTRDYELEFDTDSLGLTVHIGEDWLRRWAKDPTPLFSRPLMARNGWGYPLAAMLETMALEGLEHITLPRETIADQLGAFIAMMAETPNPNAKTSRYLVNLLERIKTEMRNCYHEVELSPGHIADRIGISKRHLHGLFAREGTTFGSTLLNYRLEQAAAMLADPRHGESPIGEITTKCGFVDQSHFARRFRQKFGVTPKQYRNGGLTRIFHPVVFK